MRHPRTNPGRLSRLLISSLLLLGLPLFRSQVAAAQSEVITFPETSKSIKGTFLRYWSSSGATARYGLPISDEVQEESSTDGKRYTMQYFERAVFEMHPENLSPYDVLLSLLGTFMYDQKYPMGAPDQMTANTPDARFFPETGKHLDCQFLGYWLDNGGLARFGYPISDELVEKSEVDGSPVRVQYFQRAVLRYDQEAISHFMRDAGYVTIPSMGTLRYSDRHGGQVPQLPAAKATAGPAECSPTPHGPSRSEEIDEPPLRASVGKGLVVTGTVRSSYACTPLATAEITYWLAGPDGQYDPDHEGKVFADSAGRYRFESNFPGFYGAGGPHVHLYVTGPGHQGIELEIFVACGQSEGIYDVVLAPSAGTVVPTATGTIGSSAEACAPTYDDVQSPISGADAPVRSVVGRGHVVSGSVKSSADCSPVAGAKMELWPEGPNGGHPGELQATVYTDDSGAYRFECNPTDHIHMRITAPGYQTITTNAYHTHDKPEGKFDIVLAPQGR